MKQLLKWMPRKANIQRYPILKHFAKAARNRPYLWSFKVTQCTPAFYAGAIIAFLPFYGIQLPLAFGAAILLRANLPIACGLQIITNPLTLIPLYYTTYQLGRGIIDVFSYGRGLNRVATEFNALMIGGILIGALAGAVLDLLYRLAAHEARKFNLVRDPGDEAASPNGARGGKEPRPKKKAGRPPAKAPKS